MRALPGQPAGQSAQSAGQRDSQTGTVSAVIQGGKLVLDVVAVPVLASADTDNIIMRYGSCPHHIGTRAVIFRICNYPWCFFNHGKKYRLTKTIGNFRKLESAIEDYNRMFGTKYSTDGEKFQNYYKDVSLRMKNKELDLLIVVNMFLTGFDAPTLNTLFVDKNLPIDSS